MQAAAISFSLKSWHIALLTFLIGGVTLLAATFDTGNALASVDPAAAVDGDLDGVCNRGSVSSLCQGSDYCPTTPAAQRPVDQNGCSRQQVDSDMDGVCNRGIVSSLCQGSDYCPSTPPGAPVDDRGCSQRQVDSDTDGVCNRGIVSSFCYGSDSCPSYPAPGTMNGCPGGPPAACHDLPATIIGSGNIQGTEGDDVIMGSGGQDVIDGLGGNDTICALAGDDTLTGGLGDDTIDGGGGHDTLVESGGRFTLTNTSLQRSGTGDGTDQLISTEEASLTGRESLSDTLDASAFTLGPVTLNGLGGADTLTGSPGDDTLTGGPGRDIITGGGGIDTVVETRDANFTLTNATLIIGSEGTDALSGIEQAILTGGRGANALDASAFNLGSVTLNGGDGNDTLVGGADDDTLNGGPGTDTCDGGAGTDVALQCETEIGIP